MNGKGIINKYLDEVGADGYALYFYCIEIIAGELTPENITFELEHDAEILAYKLKIDTIRVEEIMKYCVSLGLFQVNPATKRIMCLTLAKRVDEYMSKNPEINKIKNKMTKESVPTKYRQYRDNITSLSDQITLHDITLHNTKLNNKEKERERPTEDEKMTMDTPFEYSEGNPYTKISANQFNKLLEKAEGQNIPGYGIKLILDYYADWIQEKVLEHPKSSDYKNRSAYHNITRWVFAWWFKEGCKLPIPEKIKNKTYPRIKPEDINDAK